MFYRHGQCLIFGFQHPRELSLRVKAVVHAFTLSGNIIEICKKGKDEHASDCVPPGLIISMLLDNLLLVDRLEGGNGYRIRDG